MASKVSQDPTPAPGQLWKSQINGTVKTVAATSPHTTTWVGGGYDFTRTLPESYDCIGISTPAGRVMVGERRQSDCPSSPGAHVVVRVINDTFVSMRDADGDDLAFGAARVASWTLISPPIPAAVAPKGPAWGDRALCKCGAPMPAWCYVCPGCAAETIMARPGGKSVASYATREDVERALSAPFPKLTQEQANRLADSLGLRMGRPAPSADPREQGPGIARLPPAPRPSVRPDVVVCAEWDERWGWA